ncbi:3524_t:CDS:2 [Funneliformis geosporum]|nr:3524_t:CDS:2 [Funneliformis geosporum]
MPSEIWTDHDTFTTTTTTTYRKLSQKTVLIIAYNEQELIEFQAYLNDNVKYQSKDFIIKGFIKDKYLWPRTINHNYGYRYGHRNEGRHSRFQFVSHLTSFLQVVSMIGSNYEHQKIIIQCCVEAQIRRFIAWEFGVDLQSPILNYDMSVLEGHELDEELDNTPKKFNYTLLQTGYLSNEILSSRMGFHLQEKMMTFYGKGIEPLNLTFNQDLMRLLCNLICNDGRYEWFRKKIVIGKRTSQLQIYEEIKNVTKVEFKIVRYGLQDIPYDQQFQRLLAVGRLKAFVGRNTEVRRYFPGFEPMDISKWIETQSNSAM